MAMWCVSLDEAEEVKESIRRVFEILETNQKAFNEFKNGEGYYQQLKEYFCHWVRFLKTSNILPEKTSFYRVRDLDDKNINGVSKKSELMYAPKGVKWGRMNNHSLNVMYTSYHEYTAIAECRLKENEHFQLTRFESGQPIKYFELGLFAKLYFTTPRDSQEFKHQVEQLFGEGNYSDSAVRGFAALESALIDGLYSINENSDMSYMVSSVIADSIFSEVEDIDAIMFPSLQQRFGVNIAFRELTADNLDVCYTCVNKITKAFKTGHYKYQTIRQCVDLTENVLKYEDVTPQLRNHHCTYR